MQRMSPCGVPLPTGVHHKNGALYRVRRNKWRWLCLDGSERELHEALALLAPSGPPSTVAELLAAYLRDGMNDLKPKTRREYKRIALGRLSHHFGRMRIDALHGTHVAQYLEMRQRDGAGPMGNRERACLSSAYEYGLRRGLAAANPCRGIRRNKERAAKAYVGHEQLIGLIDRAPAFYQPFLQALYLTGWRVSDVIGLERSALGDDGIRIVEAKNNVEHFKAWSPTLREVVQAAIRHGDDVSARYKRPKPARVFVGRYGSPLTYDAVASQMGRLGRPFELRQVRAKLRRMGRIGPEALGPEARRRSLRSQRFARLTRGCGRKSRRAWRRNASGGRVATTAGASTPSRRWPKAKARVRRACARCRETRCLRQKVRLSPKRCCGPSTTARIRISETTSPRSCGSGSWTRTIRTSRTTSSRPRICVPRSTVRPSNCAAGRSRKSEALISPPLRARTATATRCR